MKSAARTDLSQFAAYGDVVSVRDGTCLFKPGDECGAFLIVLTGTVRVEQTSASGRTIVLYRVMSGDSCILTTSGLLSGRPYSGYGYAEGNVSAVSVPPKRFKSLVAKDTSFRDAVFKGFASRVGELTDVIDELLAYRTDVKLARWLALNGSITLKQTQEQIANEIGTAREVVSRVLKSFEERGWVKVSRRSILVTDQEALTQFAKSEQA